MDSPVSIPVSSAFNIIGSQLDSEYESILLQLEEKLYNLQERENFLDSSNKELGDLNKQLNKLVEKWEEGEKNCFQSLTHEDRQDILDVFFIMINEYQGTSAYVSNAKKRLRKRLSLHNNFCDAIVDLMEELISIMGHKLFPDKKSIYLDTSELSADEIDRIAVGSEENKRIEIGKESVKFNPAHLHIEGNQVLIDPKNLAAKERQALAKSLDPAHGSNSSVAIPVRALVQVGEAVDKENIKTVNFEEENPDPNPEEADESMYGEDHVTGDETKPNDGLGLDE